MDSIPKGRLLPSVNFDSCQFERQIIGTGGYADTWKGEMPCPKIRNWYIVVPRESAHFGLCGRIRSLFAATMYRGGDYHFECGRNDGHFYVTGEAMDGAEVVIGRCCGISITDCYGLRVFTEEHTYELELVYRKYPRPRAFLYGGMVKSNAIAPIEVILKGMEPDGSVFMQSISAYVFKYCPPPIFVGRRNP
ncbi:hypothetical protein IJI29_00270 [Candidatus Saccharibacteria bacterium]|nr:hypothetical protein [Candidatus Saccharibacteria bacterium]